MNATETKAVFLSYASQDAEAARRICEALRSIGIEVWFDSDGGLEHGDEWDAKIRKQIKECVLFLPIISANTQAREEGYFRLEWDLAAERARTIAGGVPFILPVVIDETRESDALVPDRFRMVQWTRLRGGEVPNEVRTRFARLWAQRSGSVKREPAAGDASAVVAHEARGVPAARGTNRRRFALAAAVIIAAAVGAWLWLGRSGVARPKGAAAAPASDSRQLVAAIWEQLNKPELFRAELEIADGLGKRATELDPQNAEAWAAWSQVDSWSIYHALATGPAAAEAARTKAARALNLAPQSYEARLAQACYLVRGVGESGISSYAAQAETLLRQLLQEQPDEPRALLALAILLRNLEKPAETRQTLQRLARNPAWTAMAYNELGWAEYHFHEWAAADAAADQALAARPYWAPLGLKIDLALWWRGDVALAKAMFARLPLAFFQEDWGIEFAWQLHMVSGEPANALRALASAPRDWLNNGPMPGPTACFAGWAHAALQQNDAARLNWTAALKVVDSRLNDAPKSPLLLWWKGTLQVLVGQRDEGERNLRLARDVAAGDVNASLSLEYDAYDYVLLGRFDDAVRSFEAGVASASSDVLLGRLTLDPRLKPLHGHAGFEALRARVARDPRLSPVAGSTSEPAARAPSDKSIAVLAFANLSDDRSNESFSDGISEELLNVLAKVPALKVTARTSAFFFKGKNLPIPEIARQLGVAYVVEGSVQRVGDQVKITAQLIKAADGFHVWSDTFRRDARDVFAVEEEIAGLIAKQLSLQLGASSAAARAPVNPEAFELYSRARDEWRKRSEDSLKRGEELLHRALALEPNFARAHAALADVWLVQGQNADAIARFDQRNSPEIQRIVAQAEQALKIDEESAEAHSSLGAVFWVGWRRAEAERELRRALALNPGYASAHQFLGRVLHDEGRMDEALEQMRIAMELDPLSSRIADNYGSTLMGAGRFREALTVLERAVQLQPDNFQAGFFKAATLVALGLAEEAVALVRRWPTGDPVTRMGKAMVLGQTGSRAEAVAIVSAPDVQRVMRQQSWFALEEPAKAVARLRPDEARSILSGALLFDPLFDPVRGDPRFLNYLDALGLRPAHARAQAWRAAHPPERGEPKK